MIKLSQEKVKNPINVKHVTDKKYKYPIIDVNNERLQSQGFGANAYGPGFYTTDDKEVLNGYKRDDSYYVRNHIIPRGATILDYNNAPLSLVYPILENVVDDSDPIIDLSNYSFNHNLLNKHLLSKGIDVIKYRPGKNFKTGKNFKSYNYLIINEDIINNPRGRKDYSETEKM